jgi:hypothetical protein
MIRQGRLISSTVLVAIVMGSALPGPSEAAGACEAFSQTEAFDELARLVAKKRHGTIQTTLYHAIVGELCDSDEIVQMMERMGWTHRRTVNLRSIDTVYQNIKYNTIIVFCDAWGFPRSIFGGCGGVAYIHTMYDRIVYLAAGGNI